MRIEEWKYGMYVLDGNRAIVEWISLFDLVKAFVYIDISFMF